MARPGRFSFLLFLFFCLAAVFSLDAYPFVAGVSRETSPTEIVLSVFGTLGILFGTAFSENFKNFIKSSVFLKGDAPAADKPGMQKAEGQPYSDKNPPIQKAEGPEGSGGLDAVLDKLKKAITDGTVEMTEDAIRGWCSANGVSDEDCQAIVSALIEEPAQDVQKSDALEEGTHEEPDGDEFEKSLMKVMTGMNNKILALEKTVTGFQKSTKDSIAAKDKEIQFLKSELKKYSNQPVNPKAPVKDITGSGYGSASSQMSRPEVIGQIKKGIGLKLCGLDDLLAYESKGKLPENFSQIPAA